MRAKRQGILQKLGLALWSMLTLVLFFCVVLLAREMLKGGRDPLAMLRPEPKPQAGGTAAAPKSPETAPGTRDVVLYFGSVDGTSLAAERRPVECGDSAVENCRQALKELIVGSKGGLTPILPSNVQVRGVYLLENGELVVDFSRELISEHARFSSAEIESLMVQGVVNTLAQPALQGKSDAPVQRVRFLFEGSPPYEAFPAHVDLNEPIAPDPAWIAEQSSAAPHA